MQVLVAGTPEQVEAAVADAEPLREELLARGMIIIPLPIFKLGGGPTETPVSLQDLDGSEEDKSTIK